MAVQLSEKLQKLSMMKRSSSSWTSLALAMAILAMVCCSLPCSAFKDDQNTIAATINAAGYKAHEPQGGHVGWRHPPRPKRPCRSSYPDYGSEYALRPPPAAALKDGQESQVSDNSGGGDRKGSKPPSPWGRPGYGHR